MKDTTPAVGDRVTITTDAQDFNGRTGTITWVADDIAGANFPYCVTLDGDDGPAYFTPREIVLIDDSDAAK